MMRVFSSLDQDRFSEVLFHVSSITNVKSQDKGRFSVYFRKKHYDFMAHNSGRTKITRWCLIVFLGDIRDFDVNLL